LEEVVDRTSDSMVGRTIADKYTILSVLGGGGMGTVYLARQSPMNREVAIKIINAELADSEQYLTRFAREAERLGALEHAHIIPVIDYGQSDGVTYLVMALKKGGNLGDVIKRERPPIKEVQRYVAEIASALDYAHVRGIIHRDLKPANILLDGERNTFLTDFGIARKLGETKLTAQGMVVGSPTYMAPEAWRGEEASAETDVYSLGVILYELLTGKPPYFDKMPARLMLMHISEPIPPLTQERPDLSPYIEAVVTQALAKEREERFHSATELANALKVAIVKTATHQRQAPVRADDDGTAILPSTPIATPPPSATPAGMRQPTPQPSRPATPVPSHQPTPTPLGPPPTLAPQKTQKSRRPAAASSNNTRTILIGMGVVIVVLVIVMVLLLAAR
jgi:serine/threonine protein kinase